MSQPPFGAIGNDAQILDRGYRRYEGPRKGVNSAITSVAWHSAQRALGIRRGAGSKVLPLLSAGIAYVPAMVFVGLSALIPENLITEDILPSYGDYYGFITSAILIFTAFVAPEVLCTDRRTGMLGLYLASPLNRDTYLVAKAMAVAGVLSIVTIGPPLLLLVARTVEGGGPDSVGDFLLILGRILAAGVVVTALHATFSMAVSSVTDRRAIASAAIILVLLVSSIVAGALVNGAEASETLFLLDLLALPFLLVQYIYGEQPDIDVAMPAAIAGYSAWTVAFATFVWLRYRRLEVTR